MIRGFYCILRILGSKDFKEYLDDMSLGASQEKSWNP